MRSSNADLFDAECFFFSIVDVVSFLVDLLLWYYYNELIAYMKKFYDNSRNKEQDKTGKRRHGR